MRTSTWSRSNILVGKQWILAALSEYEVDTNWKFYDRRLKKTRHLIGSKRVGHLRYFSDWENTWTNVGRSVTGAFGYCWSPPPPNLSESISPGARAHSMFLAGAKKYHTRFYYGQTYSVCLYINLKKRKK